MILDSGMLSEDKVEYVSLYNDLKEIIAMLTSTVKTMKNKIKNK